MNLVMLHGQTLLGRALYPQCCIHVEMLTNRISFIERHQSDVIERILRYCDLCKETPTRVPPVELPVPPQQFSGPILDFEFFPHWQADKYYDPFYWATLPAAACIESCIFPRDDIYFIDIIREHRVTTCHFVPSMLRFFKKSNQF